MGGRAYIQSTFTFNVVISFKLLTYDSLDFFSSAELIAARDMN